MKITLQYFAKPGRREEFLHRIVTGGILDAIRKEDGCQRYDYYLSCQNEDEVLLLEEWESEAQQQVHMEQEHMKQLMEIKNDCIADTRLQKD